MVGDAVAMDVNIMHKIMILILYNARKFEKKLSGILSFKILLNTVIK